MHLQDFHYNTNLLHCMSHHHYCSQYLYMNPYHMLMPNPSYTYFHHCIVLEPALVLFPFHHTYYMLLLKMMIMFPDFHYTTNLLHCMFQNLLNKNLTVQLMNLNMYFLHYNNNM